MKSAFLLSPTQVIALGLALLSAGPVLAQKTAVPAKNAGVKTKTVAAAGTIAVANPQPVSPVAAAPQLVAAIPVAAIANSRSEMPAGWVSDLGAAQARAKATNRPIVAVFSGSDWCKPCIMYEQEVFAKPEFMAFAKDKLVLAHFDFPRQKKNQPSAAQLKLNEAAAAQLNREATFRWPSS